MKVIKSLEPSALFKVFRYQKRNVLSMGVAMGFSLSDPKKVVLEQDLWAKSGEALNGGVLDECMPKIYPEVLVQGCFHSPNGELVESSSVRLKFGKEVDKSLLVFGDRFWTMLGRTKTRGISQLPINYQHAFGGEGYADNPVGKGHAAIEDAETEDKIHPLPNVEDPKKPIVFKGDRPNPVGLGSIDPAWPQRASRMGSYGGNYVEEHFPGFSPSIDMEFFNCAPEDQWIKKSRLLGDETFELYHFHPDRPLIKGRLPHWRARAFITQRALEPKELDPYDLEGFKEIELKPETVWFFPDQDLGIVIHRGNIQVREDDTSDLSHLLLAYEDQSQEPRSHEHYKSSLVVRVDEETASDYAFDSAHLIPNSMACAFQQLMEDDGEADKLSQNLEKRMLELEAQLAEDAKAEEARLLAKEQSGEPQKAGIQQGAGAELPATEAPSEEVELGLNDLKDEAIAKLEANFVGQGERLAMGVRLGLEADVQRLEGQKDRMVEFEQAKARLALFVSEAEPYPRPQGASALIQAQVAKRGHDLNCERLILMGVPRDFLPVFGTDLEVLEKELEESDRGFRESYLLSAHQGDPGKAAHALSHDDQKKLILRHIREDRSCAKMDCAELDFSGEDLKGIDFSDCFMEHINLEGADLRRANLKGAVLAGARLKNCCFDEAQMEQCNIGACDGTSASFKHVNLSGATLEGGCFDGADFSNAQMNELQIHSSTDFSRALFQGTQLTGSQLSELNLNEAQFQEANLSGSTLIQCRGLEIQFTSAQLEQCSFLECSFEQSNFEKSQLSKANFLGGCELSGCHFNSAQLVEVGMRECQLKGANFSDALVQMSDLCQSNLIDTIWKRADMSRSLFMKSDLTGADLNGAQSMKSSYMKARMVNVDFSGANLYGCEFMGATLGNNRYRKANFDLTLLSDWKP
jgi:uncharacterized protein YjbI with pentapeptide repeats